MINIISANKKRSYVCIAGMILNLILFFTKLYVALSSNSVSIYVDSLNSLSDTIVCIIAVIGFRIADIAPNEKYPFGYGKIKELINIILSGVILFTGAIFVYTSLQRLMYPVPVWFSSKYALIICITAVIKIIMALFFKLINNKYNSDIIKNFYVDSILDFFISLCVVISFTLTNKVSFSVDAVTGIAVGIIVIIFALKDLINSCASFIGKRDNRICDKAYEIIISNSEIKDVTDLQCHSYGDKKIFTAEVISSEISKETEIDLNNKIKNEFDYKLNSKIIISFGGIN